MCLFVLYRNASVAMFPSYHPALSADTQRDKLIKEYFDLGYTYKEIVASLVCTHGITLSLRHLKRILKRHGLRRKLPDGGESPLADIIIGIDKELNGSGKCLGYRTMWRRLLSEYKLHVKRDTVLELLWLMDPEGVQRRKSHRLLRRKYCSPGPNYVWHIDGYDKLKPFGFPIHGAIDGFSRRIIWLRVGRTNNDPLVIGGLYLEAVKQLKCVPRILRCDGGTENAILKYFQPYFRLDCEDRFAGANSLIMGKSTSNQRIESWWSVLRKQNADWWIAMFKDLRDNGIFQDQRPLHKECLKFCFMHILQSELDRIIIEWNTHCISSKRNAEGPKGKPDIMFFNPALYDSCNYGTPVDIEDANTFVDAFGIETGLQPCLPEFFELLHILKPDIVMPTNVEEATHLFEQLTQLLDNIVV